MHIAVYANDSRHQARWCAAFASGLNRHGVPVLRPACFADASADVGVFWGMRQSDLISLYAERSGVIVLERGFVDRIRHAAAGWNGINGHADFCATGADGSRWANLRVPLRPWKTGGGYILLLGQVSGDASVLGIDLHKIFNEVCVSLRQITRQPIYYRPHPLARLDWCPAGARILCGSLEDALRGADCAITYNSNSAVDAVIAGVQTITLDRGAIAWPVTRHRVDDIAGLPRPDRSQWLNELAASQWTMQEMTDGKAWNQLKRRLD